jgi:type IX secretion system PorP/SprF family membrane protein
MKAKKAIISASFLFLGWNAMAQQDIHFSQFYSAPGIINPASTGVFNGNVRAFLNYRSQWKTITEPFTTISGAFDSRLFEDQLKNGFIGLGVFMYNDVAGTSQLTTGNYGLNLSYSIELADDMYLSIGVQPSMIQKSISYAGLYYGSQFTGVSFDEGLNSGEANTGLEVSAFDLAGGVYYLYRFTDETAMYAGVSAAHLTAPNISFNGAGDPLLRKYTFHGGAELMIPNTHVSFLPNTLIKVQGPNRIINIGTDFKYIFQEQSHFTGFVNESSFGLGAYYRVGDAFWGTAQFSWTGFTLAFSYDLNISDLTVATNGNGGMEALLMYRAGIGTGKGKSTRFL